MATPRGISPDPGKSAGPAGRRFGWLRGTCDGGFRGWRRVTTCNGMVQLLVWYDGACPLCRREIALMRRLDRRGAIDFVDVTQDDASCPTDRAALLARFHARENGVVVSGAEAFAAMWRAIPLLRPLGLLARNRWVLAGLERGYVRFLGVRPGLQRWIRGAAPRPAKGSPLGTS